VVCDDYVPEWFHGIFPERKGEMLYFQKLNTTLVLCRSCCVLTGLTSEIILEVYDLVAKV